MTDFSALKQQFSSLSFDFDTSLPRLRCGQNNGAIELFLQGAHLSRFTTRSGCKVLFVSRESQFEAGKAVRGGIPICFPWFGPKIGDPSAAAHGFARTKEWEIIEASEQSVTLALASDAQTLSLWPYPFRLVYRIEFEEETLRLALEIHNTGDTNFWFEVALHTYFQVADIGAVRIEGLDGKTYLDKTCNYVRKVQEGEVEIAGEVDRAYLDSSGPITMREADKALQISDLSGWRSTVVWNPWSERARAMSDLGDDEWKQFVCIECGAVADDAVQLEASQSCRVAIEIEVGARL